jgi:hypothetical protein
VTRAIDYSGLIATARAAKEQGYPIHVATRTTCAEHIAEGDDKKADFAFAQPAATPEPAHTEGSGEICDASCPHWAWAESRAATPDAIAAEVAFAIITDRQARDQVERENRWTLASALWDSLDEGQRDRWRKHPLVSHLSRPAAPPDLRAALERIKVRAQGQSLSGLRIRPEAALSAIRDEVEAALAASQPAPAPSAETLAEWIHEFEDPDLPGAYLRQKRLADYLVARLSSAPSEREAT